MASHILYTLRAVLAFLGRRAALAARATWRYGRNLPALIMAWRRWPELACASGLGKFKTKKIRKDGEVVAEKEIPTNYTGARRFRLTPCGYSFIATHRFGQSINAVRDVIPELESGLRGQVRVLRAYDKHGRLLRNRSRVVVNRRDPWAKVPKPLALSPTLLRIGVLEDGRDWVQDFRKCPMLLGAGETGSGKSGTESAMLAALAPTDAVVTMIDLKHGVSAEPYRPRASKIAETVEDAATLLSDLLELGARRAELVKRYVVDKVYDLPASIRPREVYCFVDEVAELNAHDGTKEGRAASDQAWTDLLRAVQKLRAFGIHVLIFGQRFGSEIGKKVTSVRAQLSGRICHQVSDAETGRMVVADCGDGAVDAALSITLPGVAVVKGGPDGWQMARSSEVSHADLATIAQTYADKRTAWEDVTAHYAEAGDVIDAEATVTDLRPVVAESTDEQQKAA